LPIIDNVGAYVCASAFYFIKTNFDKETLSIITFKKADSRDHISTQGLHFWFSKNAQWDLHLKVLLQDNEISTLSNTMNKT